MEDKLLKTMAQLTLIFIVAFVAVKAFTPPPPPQPARQSGGNGTYPRAKGDVWNRGGVQAPAAQRGLVFAPGQV